MTIERCLLDLSEDSKPLSHSSLMQLSGLAMEELGEFEAAWSMLSGSRKCAVLAVLSDLVEDNLDLDFDPVFRASLTDSSEDVREMATCALWECNDRSIIRPLVRLLSDDPSPKVRAAAAMALANFAEMAQGGKLLKRDSERIVEALLAATSGEEKVEVRRRAIETIAGFDVPSAEGIIREAYESNDARLKQSAVFAMGRSSDTHWLPIIMDEIRHGDSAMRYEAASACANLGDQEVVPELIGLIGDDDLQVQVSAVEALGVLGGPLARQALLRCLEMGDEAIEEAAESALNSIAFDDDPLGFRF